MSVIVIQQDIIAQYECNYNTKNSSFEEEKENKIRDGLVDELKESIRNPKINFEDHVISIKRLKTLQERREMIINPELKYGNHSFNYTTPLCMPRRSSVKKKEIFANESVICPLCGVSGNDIKIVKDYSRIVSYIPMRSLYSEKYVCTKCGYEF